MEKEPEKSGISLDGMFGLALVKKEDYFGSHRGMRFRLGKAEDKLQATVYPEPYSWDATPQEQKESRLFPLSDEGIRAAVEWLNEMYQRKYENCNFSV